MILRLSISCKDIFLNPRLVGDERPGFLVGFLSLVWLQHTSKNNQYIRNRESFEGSKRVDEMLFGVIRAILLSQGTRPLITRIYTSNNENHV